MVEWIAKFGEPELKILTYRSQLNITATFKIHPDVFVYVAGKIVSLRLFISSLIADFLMYLFIALILRKDAASSPYT